MIWPKVQKMSLSKVYATDSVITNFWQLNQRLKPNSLFHYKYKPTETYQLKKKIKSEKINE